jgi:nicotinamide mononucleotide (NMN) deamidase PncC
VSVEVAEAMARGALDCSQADIAVSVTGVAGPDPDDRGNRGLVYLELLI